MYDIIKTYGDVVYFEEDHNFSKERVTVPDGFTVELGEVLGKVTASGEYVPLDPAASDGSEIAAGIALTAKDLDIGDQVITVLVRHAIAKKDSLIWPDTISVPEQAAAEEQLVNMGVLLT